MIRDLRMKLAIPTVAASLLLLAACGGDDSSTDTTKPDSTTVAPTTTEATTTTEAGTSDTAVDDEQAQTFLLSLMLTADDLDDTFVDGEDPEVSPVTPCNTNLDEDVPFAAAVARRLSSDEYQLGLVQEVRVYTDVDTAAQALAAAVDGLSCGATDDGTTISEPLDMTTEVGGTSAYAVSLDNPDIEGSIIVAQVDDALALYVFSGAVGSAEASGAPSPIDVAAEGVSRLIAAQG